MNQSAVNLNKIDITKVNTIEQFIKSNSELRVSNETVKLFLNFLNDISLEIVKQSETSARQSNRNTIMEEDIKKSVSDVIGSTGDINFIFKQIEKLNAKDTAKLSELIQNWLKSNE